MKKYYEVYSIEKKVTSSGFAEEWLEYETFDLDDALVERDIRNMLCDKFHFCECREFIVPNDFEGNEDDRYCDYCCNWNVINYNED